MKTILVPTDFSHSAETALHMAMLMAKTHKAKLLLMHVITPPVTVSPLPDMMIPPDLDAIRADCLNKLKALSGQIDYAGNISYEYFVTEGGIIDQIMESAGEKRANLIVMGISQKRGLQKYVFGGIAEGVINRSEIPVLLVPAGILISMPLKKITFAVDYLSTDLADLDEVVELARPFQAGVTIMHISTEEYEPETEVKAFHDFVQRAVHRSRYQAISAEFLTGPDISLRLINYLEEGDTDLLVMSARHRGLLARTFGKSLTRKAIKTETRPVVVFHHKEAKKDPRHQDLRKSASLE